jgi:hypothetical protein
VVRKKELIDFDFTPEDHAEERYNRLAGREAPKHHGRYYFHLDVWGCKARLCLVDTEGDGSIEPVDLGIAQEKLEQAVFNSGGALLLAGHYPIDQCLRTLIEERLEAG